MAAGHTATGAEEMNDAENSGPRTLAIDIGGTGLKASVLDELGKMVTKRVRVPTPAPCPPDTLLESLAKLTAPLPDHDRISIGFPGVVRDGNVITAPQFPNKAWLGFPLEDAISQRLGKPARLLNDAEVQGLGIITGQGLEVVLTLGTGVGSAVFSNGAPTPHLELAHHPIRKDKTYNEYIGNVAYRALSKKKWNKRVLKTIDIVYALLHYDVLYLGGGNAANIDVPLPANVHIASNNAGITGGIRLWDDTHLERRRRGRRRQQLRQAGALTGVISRGDTPSLIGIMYGLSAHRSIRRHGLPQQSDRCSIAIGGLLAMAAGMGVGRFVYTPILPPMVEALSLSKSQAGLIASANFVGYLAGALLRGDAPGGLAPGLAARLAGGEHALSRGDGLDDVDAGLPGLRLMAGVVSAFILVLSSALVLERLAASGKGALSAVHFAGVGRRHRGVGGARPDVLRVAHDVVCQRDGDGGRGHCHRVSDRSGSRTDGGRHGRRTPRTISRRVRGAARGLRPVRLRLCHNGDLHRRHRPWLGGDRRSRTLHLGCCSA